MSKRDHLSDVLCRIADYLTQSPADYATWGTLLVELSQQAKQTDGGSSGLKVTFSAKNASGPELSFAVPSQQVEVEAGSKQGPEDQFGWFMNQLNELNFCSCVEVKLETTAQQSQSAKAGTTEQSPKVLKITKLLEDKQVFDHSSEQDSGNRVAKASTNQSLGSATSNPVTQDQSGQQVGIDVEMGSVTTDTKPSNGDATKSSEEGMQLDVPVFKSDTFPDVQRRIENLSLAMFPGHDKPGLVTEQRAKEITTRFLTLPQPIWQKSTLILQQSAGGGGQPEQLQLFSEGQFDQFKNGELDSKSFLLLRTQGSGCHLTKQVVQRILHQVAFLLPLQFGSVWVISGGTNKGIMQVHCAALR
jgi:hypothetical protein